MATIQTYLSSDVPKGGTVTFAKPQSLQDAYDLDACKLCLGSQEVEIYSGGYSLAWDGSGTITATNTGGVWVEGNSLFLISPDQSQGGKITKPAYLSAEHFSRDFLPHIASAATGPGRTTLVVPDMGIVIGPVVETFLKRDVDLNNPSAWDDAQYATAVNRSGKDFYLYATSSGLILSANATGPAGYTASNSRKIGGFHCICLSVGTISGHTLTGFLTGDILPASIWDLSFRSSSLIGNIGAVWHPAYGMWYDIYIPSGTGKNTTSIFGGTITDTRAYWDHNDDLGSVGKRMLFDNEFSVVAYGSPEGTNIMGSVDPVTTGGHVDTASRRIISNIGCEDCTGVMHQWIDGGHVYRNDDASYAGGWSWRTAGSRGQQYTQGANGAVGLLAGGYWNLGSRCGSRCRAADSTRSNTGSIYGSRGCARSQGGQ